MIHAGARFAKARAQGIALGFKLANALILQGAGALEFGVAQGQSVRFVAQGGQQDRQLGWRG
jgi:hypothetical protein